MATTDTGEWQQVNAGEISTGVGVRLADTENRVGLGLSFLDGRKVVDVSIDPTSWVGCLRSTAHRQHEPRNRWADALASALRRAGSERGWWDELSEELAPEVTAAAAAWPLLRLAIENGFDERFVPRWASPLVSAVDVATGTRSLLGARADRRVVREMASALRGPVRWWPIGCAVALEQLDSGRIGDLLAESTSTYRCSQDELILLACTLGTARPQVVRQLLASANVGGGPARLLEALDGWRRINGDSRNLANRLDRLEAAVVAELEVPPPRHRPQPQPRRPSHQEQRVLRRILNIDENPQQRRQLEPLPEPPRQLQPIPEPPCERPHARIAADQIEYDDRWRRLHRARRGTINMILPMQRSDLPNWGLALGNCLGIYIHSVEVQRVVIAGIRQNEQLVGAVEISPQTSRIRQLEGRNNRPLAPAIRSEVLDLLAEHGVHMPPPLGG